MLRERFMFPSHFVRQSAIDGNLLLLDLRRGEYLLLDEIASAIWQGLVAGATDDALLKSLQQHFDVPDGQLSADIADFKTRCIDEKLLVEWHDPVSHTHSRRRLGRIVLPTIAAWWCLLDTSRRLRRQGFAEAYRVAVEEAPKVSRAIDKRRLRCAEAAFSRAENVFLSKRAPDDCLQRSMALFRFLRSMGFPAKHSIGFARNPFSAHAWVECGNRVILDVDRRNSLTKLLVAAA